MAKALFGKADLSMNQVITIGRELGSGGRTVGKEVARLLNIPYYDRELIDEAAKRAGFPPILLKITSRKLPAVFYIIWQWATAIHMVCWGLAEPILCR